MPTTSSQPSFASGSADLAVAERAADPLHDPHPVVPEEPEQHERGREVERDEEGQEVRLVLVDVPAEEVGRMTLCPRLEIGKSSDTPWTSPRIAAWK